ncbi:aspartyl/asparaginyl beta-hydroxylase domain-containing protein [Botrimarina hoheduenensis]|uniref:Aspartyl/Asparaginyl beta-hydroxylase n=1 Tax=Botrimarina hoheduenensis TaxID=2528000 RepID=A0A5C5W0I4_9BACT|nr:aspartyl/asparaginyl beta-hydroxylase domain-containing protein [Botrimarina hoheduenensis]TWT43282.1 Aspartyl/Asparaginyl beta-hydroxylase [Botrimarina hoheduenensis]
MPALRELANRWYRRGVGDAARPVVHRIEAVCPALRTLETPENFDAIRSELLALLPHRKGIPKYHDLDPGRGHLSSEADGDASWRVFMLYAMGAKPAENRARCPRTCELVEAIPDLFQAFFSILEPHKSVPPHEGPYAGYLRYHLPLVVPTDKPPRMRIRDHWHTWREGEGLLFDDHWEHEVENHSDQVRVVLIVDILRPLPWLRDRVNRLVTRTLLRRRYGQRIAQGKQPDL